MDNVYVLDPDLALRRIFQQNNLEYHLVDLSGDIEKVVDTIKHLGVLDRYLRDGIDIKLENIEYIIRNTYVKQILPIIDIIRFSSPEELNTELNIYHTASKVITKDYYDKLSNIGQQFYVKLSILNTIRYKVNDIYAGIRVPPRGFYTQLMLETHSKTIEARGKQSKIFPNSLRMLLRLRDGSLLEIYEKKYDENLLNNTMSQLYSILDSIVYADPEIVKAYVLSLCLDVSQDRPAYSINKLIKLQNKQ